MKFWCKNCQHLLPLTKTFERTANWREWWWKNRDHFKMMHETESGECNTQPGQIQKIS